MLKKKHVERGLSLINRASKEHMGTLQMNTLQVLRARGKPVWQFPADVIGIRLAASRTELTLGAKGHHKRIP